MFNKYAARLIESQVQSHIYHLQTSVYASHIALEEYYTELQDKIDELIESYQGEYGILTEINVESCSSDLSHEREVVTYFQLLYKYITKIRSELPQDDFLLHQYDDIETLIKTTIYKLRFLK